MTDVLCPGLNSQIAFGEGALTQANAFAAGALDSSRRLGFDHHNFAFPALRTAAQLALERRHLDAAASLVEQILELVSGGGPLFEYLAQLDRARIWAAAGNLEGALSSLPAARTALRCDHSVLFAQADELEARLRLALGDAKGARRVAEQLPDDRRRVISALIALGANDPRTASDILSTAPPRAPPSAPIWSCACYAPVSPSWQASPRAPQLIREAVAVADRHGYVQTVLDTAPQLVDQLISDAAHYPNTDNVRSLIAAGINARKLTVGRPQPRPPARPAHRGRTTSAGSASPTPDLRRHGRPAPPVPQHGQDPSPSRLHEAGRLLPHHGSQAGHLHRHHLTSDGGFRGNASGLELVIPPR